MIKPAALYIVASPIAALFRMATCVAAFFPLLVFFSSCATVFNRPVQPIHIAADPQIKKLTVAAAISVDSSLSGRNAPKTYWVRRTNQNLPIRLQLDSASTEKTLSFRPHNSLAWWANIPGNYGLGMLIDRDNIRRYSYPAWSYLELDDTVVQVRRFAPILKGSMRLSLSLPVFNEFDIRSPKGQSNHIGVLGLGASLDIYYKKDRYLSFSLGAATSAAPVDRFGNGYIQDADEVHASIRANRVIGSFDIGYGISFSQLQWVQKTIGDTVNLNRSLENTTLGLSLSAQYRIGNYFRMGVLFQPGILSLNLSPALHYQHYLSLNFIWTFPLSRK